MKRFAFSLIELLVVIAIIAILASITFPVIARVRVTAARNSDISHMNSLRTALQLYRADQGGYPPALLGYATLYAASPGGYVTTLDGQAPQPSLNNVVPAQAARSYIYPRRLENIDVLRPSFLRVDDLRSFLGGPLATPDSRVVWPTPTETGFSIANPNDPNCALQALGPANTVKFPGTATDAYYYRVSGYDVSPVQSPSGARNELRYTLFWSGWGLGTNGCALGNGLDDKRQLGYFDPPEDTLITWNSFFREYVSGVPVRRASDIVLFLGGSARSYDSVNMSEQSWASRP